MPKYASHNVLYLAGYISLGGGGPVIFLTGPIRLCETNMGDGRAKGWMFTVNNPTDEDRPFLPDDAEYLCYQSEMGAEATVHYQGYVLFKTRKRITAIKKLKCFARAHLEVRRGSNEQAIAYCSKHETAIANTFTELGTRPQGGQGKKQLLVDCCQALRRGSKLSKLSDEFDSVRVRNIRGLRELQADLRRDSVPKWREVYVEVLWGGSGLGKTRHAYELFGHEEVFMLNQPAQGTNVWFDGYDSQRCLLIDDFEGWIPYRYLLKLLDGYPMELAVKGSFVPALYTNVVITSNVAPIDWYPNFADMGALPVPLERRISHVMHVEYNLYPPAGSTPSTQPASQPVDLDAGPASESEGEPLVPPSPKRKRSGSVEYPMDIEFSDD